MNRVASVWVVLIVAAVALAGCSESPTPTDEGTIEGKVDQGSFQLKSGKGAISGLLVDDRFRPIHLTDDPRTEFDATGFVLLQETGQQVRTSDNGEFAFVDLDPGTYTVRVSASGHEATPMKVGVQEGLFAEATVIARRVSSESSLIITEEYSGFVTCAVVVPAVTVTFNCNDGSGESYRTAAATNHTGLTNVTYMVIESMLIGEPDGQWRLVVREDNGSPQGGTGYANRLYGADDENYVKVILKYNETEVYNEEYNTNPWNNSVPMNSISFYDGALPGVGYDDVPGGMEACLLQNEVGNMTGTPQLNCGLETFGTGATFAQRTQFIISVFLGEPEVDLEAYRLLTPQSS